MRRWPVLGVALAAYAALEIRAAAAHMDVINPDAVSYLRNALYWTQGRFVDAISGYWSPLLSWCVAPPVAFGFDPLHSAYAVLGVWGALLVVAAWAMLGRWGGLPVWLEIVVLVLVAESVVTWSATAFPDVILAACLMGYGVAALSPSLFSGRGPALWAGALGGVAYLGKAYGFPFFLLHWPLTIVLFAWMRGVPRRRAAATALTGALAFAAIALPWAALLSWKFGTPTYGLVGRINHANVGPTGYDYTRDALWEPVPGRVTVWEVPETLSWGSWSPLDDAASLRHQIGYSWRTAKEIVATLQRFDALGVGLALVLLGPFIVAALDSRPFELERSLWAAMTLAVYSAPFVLVYFSYRYTAPWLKPLTILVACHVTWRIASRLPRALATGAVGVVLVSFAAHVNLPFRPYTIEEPGGTSFDNVTIDSRPHREAAQRLRAAGIGGPLASTGHWAGMYLGYFLDVPFVGTPEGDTPEACDAELATRGVQTFVVDRTWRHAGAFASMRGWRTAATIQAPSGEVLDVLVRGQNGQVYTQRAVRPALVGVLG